MAKTFNAYRLSGGTTDSLDSVPIASISDLDRAFATQDNVLYYYQFSASGTEADAEPFYIRPDDYVSAGVWELQTISDANAFPVGTYIEHAGENAPAGFLEADGSILSRATYAALFTEIGIMYGAGDGSTTFELPDCRGLFFRSKDGGAGVASDANLRLNRGDGTTGDKVGTKEADQFKSHNHVITNFNPGRKTTNGDYTVLSTESVGKVTNNTGGNETKPKNINVLVCIKY